MLATILLLVGDKGTQRSFPADASITVLTLKLNKHALVLT